MNTRSAVIIEPRDERINNSESIPNSVISIQLGGIMWEDNQHEVVLRHSPDYLCVRSFFICAKVILTTFSLRSCATRVQYPY